MRVPPPLEDVAPRIDWNAHARQLAAWGTNWQRKADAALAWGGLERADQYQELASMAAHGAGLLELHDGATETGR